MPSIALRNMKKIPCIIFENLFGPYFLPHQSHSFGYAPSSGENLTSKIQFKSEAGYFFIFLSNLQKCGGISLFLQVDDDLHTGHTILFNVLVGLVIILEREQDRRQRESSRKKRSKQSNSATKKGWSNDHPSIMLVKQLFCDDAGHLKNLV